MVGTGEKSVNARGRMLWSLQRSPLMKALKKIVLIVVLLVIVGIGAGVFYLDGIVRKTVETQATASLNVPTTLGGASVKILGGSVGLSDLNIGSPKGFSAPQMFSLGGLKVDTGGLANLRSDPLKISLIDIQKPKLVIEQSGGKFNFKALMDQIPATPESESKPLKLIIEKLNVTDATVTIRPGIPGMDAEINVPIPSMTLSNIGNADGNANGAAIKEVVGQTVTALAAKATESDLLPAQLKQLMSLDINAVAGMLGGEFNRQLGNITKDLTKNLSGELGKAAGDVLKNDAGKKAEEGLKGLLGGEKKK